MTQIFHEKKSQIVPCFDFFKDSLATENIQYNLCEKVSEILEALNQG